MAFWLCFALAERKIEQSRRGLKLWPLGAGHKAGAQVGAPNDDATRGADRIVDLWLCVALAEQAFRRSRQTVNTCALGAAVIAAGVALHADGGSTTPVASAGSIQPLAVPPEPPPMILRQVSRQDAIAINLRIPFSVDENVAAKPFRFSGDAEARTRALQCLTLAVYYEAADQGEEGEAAVAQVVLNRVRHPAFPPSICGVVFQGSAGGSGCQFTFTCDGSLLRNPDPDQWLRAQKVAKAALDGSVFKPVGLATHYHANYVVPYWATRLEKNAQVGAHIFYRWPDAWGMPAAFARTYAGKEADPAALRAAAIMEEGSWALGTVSPDNRLQLTIDPRIELLSVVQMLANGSSNLAPADQRYASDVQSYFAPEADHEAVQLFKKLSKANDDFATLAAQLLLSYSPPPDLARKNALPADGDVSAATDKNLAEFVDALGDFARSSNFDRFFAGHKPFYNSVLRRTQQQVGMARGYWAAYTGLPLHSRKIVLSSLMDDEGLGECRSCAGSAATILSLGTIEKATDADILLRTESVREAFAAPNGDKRDVADPALDEQIVRAVFDRVAVLRRNGDAGPPSGESASVGTVPASALDGRLVEYEKHRGEFRTFGEFVARVLVRQSDGESAAASKQSSPRLPSTAAQIEALSISQSS